MEIPPNVSFLPQKQQQLFLTIQKVANAIMKKKGLIPDSMEIKLDYYMWASNRLFANINGDVVERITLESGTQDLISLGPLCDEYKRLLNILHRSMGIKGQEINKIQVRRKLRIKVRFEIE
jgi:hypothetical protein